MSRFRVGGALLLAGVSWACNDGEQEMGSLVALGSSGPTRSLGSQEPPPHDGLGGASGEHEQLCGNGRRELEEECDPSEQSSASCQDFGLESGTVACSATCEWDLSSCSGAENCSDGLDNDGDAEVDCSDADCAEACSLSCDGATVMDIQSGEMHLWGSTVGRTSELDAVCSFPNIQAPERVFAVRAAETGVLAASLWTVEPLGVSWRSSCGDDGELSSCTGDQVELSVQAGDVSYLVVDGLVGGAEGEFDLTLSLRSSSSCGDGQREGSEGCDDGNLVDGDGCTQSCTRELSESEPNDSVPEAQAWSGSAPYFGEFSSSSDEDFLLLELLSAQAKVRFRLDDDGGQGCSQEEPGMNPAIELLSSSGDPLAWDGDSGLGDCAELVLTDLEAGSYYLRLHPEMSGSFPYRLTMLSE